MECLAGLRPVDGGRVRVLGLDPHHQTREVRERVGVQLQQSRLPARLRVGEALHLYASFYPAPADPQARHATWELIRRVRDRGVTVVLVTHDMDEAEHLCDRLAIINHGTVTATGSPRDLTAPTGESTYTLRLAADPGLALTALRAELPGIRARRVLDGAIEIGGGPQSLAAALTTLADHRMAVEAVRAGTRTLEDVVVELAEAP